MIWRQDRYWIYVVYDDGTWEVLEDTWEEGDLPFDPELTPPAGMHQPLGRLGKVWREQPRVRERLGWAMADEMTFTGIFQPFEKGELISQPPEQMYVLLEDLRLRALSFEGGSERSDLSLDAYAKRAPNMAMMSASGGWGSIGWLRCNTTWSGPQ